MIDELCKAIIDQLHINKFVETGTGQGETVALAARWFSELHPEFGQIEKLIINGAKTGNPWNTCIPYPIFKMTHATFKDNGFKIFSVDNKPELIQRVKVLFSSNPHIVLRCQSSEQFLKELIDTRAIGESDACFFFLDAHDGKKYFPLRDEISQILRLGRFMIMVDDFKVPGHLEFGYNTRVGGVFEWEFIKDLFRNRKVETYYPIRSNRDNRGWMLIMCGYSREELRFMGQLPVIRGSIWVRLIQPFVIHYRDYIKLRGKAQPLVRLRMKILEEARLWLK